MPNRFPVTTWILILGAVATPAIAVEIRVNFDRWMYPFNATPGARSSGSTFGAVQNPSFDDLDAQILLGFDTAASGVPAGAGAASYRIHAARVELTSASDGTFLLDSTYDAWTTYVDESTDVDAGRPVELYGVGFRHGFTTAAISVAMPEPGPPVFEESELFGVPGPPRSESRNVYASDYAVGSGRDVSNHVRQGFDPTPWAIGSVAGMMPGSAVPINATVEFEIDLTIPAVIEQLQAALDQGSLFFSVASKHASV